VHLDVRLFAGRTWETRLAVCARALEVLREWFCDSVAQFALQITIEVRDIDRPSYFQHLEETLPPR
jgi:5-carboxymethyl-2-hydroxymuconate isomerase